VAQQRKQYETFARRELLQQMKKIQVVHPYITEAETAVALSHCNNEEEEAVVWLTDPVNLQTIRKEVALSAMEKDGISINSNEEIDENDEDKKFIKRKRKQKGASKKKEKRKFCNL